MPEVMTISDVAALLKFTKRQVYELCRERTRERMGDGAIPLIRINSQTRFLRSEVAAWLTRLQEESR
jgi:predicted DNA-binding transcriptional regulator AlpA